MSSFNGEPGCGPVLTPLMPLTPLKQRMWQTRDGIDVNGMFFVSDFGWLEVLTSITDALTYVGRKRARLKRLCASLPMRLNLNFSSSRTDGVPLLVFIL